MSTEIMAETIAESINNLLKECGIPVGMDGADPGSLPLTIGCKWCKYSQAFFVWLPEVAAPVIDKVLDVFSKVRFSEVSHHNCKDIGASKLHQISAHY